MANQISVDYRNITDLIPYINNSRTHSENQVLQIASSIKEFGFTNPVLVDGKNGIIAGHGRVLAAQKLGMDQVPCVELSHLSEAQKKAYVIADNKLALNAGWDLDLLKIELDDLKTLDFDLSLVGFDDIELGVFFDAPDSDYLCDEDDAPSISDTAVSSLGAVWLLGDHRLMCGDATSLSDVETLMDGDLADILITDPPYNVSYEGGTKDKLTIKNDSMSDGSFRQFLIDAFSSADTVMKCGAVFYIWHADSEGFNFRAACHDIGWKIRQCLIWAKNGMVIGRQDYHWKHEPCLYGWKSGASHLWASDRRQTTIIEFDKPLRNGEHPTMKPVGLFEYQILNNTKGSDIVLDVFGGSGTTIIACEKNKRFARLMELDPKYCDVIVRRWQEFTGKEAVLASSGKTFNESSS